MILPITQDGDPVLRKTSVPVPEELFGTKELATIITNMFDTLDKEKDGVALAAPQVGISYRIFVVRYDRMREPGETVESVAPDTGVFINPSFAKVSRRQSEVPEGCLSVRGIYGTTVRYDRATVRAQDEQGVWFTRGAGGLLAQAFQHETDHLDGILFIDHASELYEQKERQPDHDTEAA